MVKNISETIKADSSINGALISGAGAIIVLAAGMAVLLKRRSLDVKK